MRGLAALKILGLSERGPKSCAQLLRDRLLEDKFQVGRNEVIACGFGCCITLLSFLSPP